jgi:hypothetical protein
VSLTPRSRLSAETVTSPMNPATGIKSPAAAAWARLKGVTKGAVTTASTKVVPTPPRNPSQVLFGLTPGMIFLPSEHLAPGVLGNVIELGQEHQEQKQACTARRVAFGRRQDQEEGRVGD